MSEISTSITPLQRGPKVSWIPWCHPGDNQGQTGACSVFAMASWVECMTGQGISDDVAVETWRSDRMKRHGNLDGGMSIPEAFFAAYSAGWFPRHTTIRRVYDLKSLALAPLIATYTLTEGWYSTNAAGCIDHKNTVEVGQHATLMVSNSRETDIIQDPLWIENSWGLDWGYKGFGCMTQEHHQKYCTQLWQVVVQGRPTSEAEADEAEARVLASSIGNYVKSMRANLVTLGYDLPCESAFVMADLVRRSTAGQLTAAQERAMGKLTDVWMILRGEGVTDAIIIRVWDVIRAGIED